MACSTGVDRAAIGDGKEEAVVLWPGICSTIVSFRYHFILGVSRFLTVCETSQSSLSLSLSLFPLYPLLFFHQPQFRKCRAVTHSILRLLFCFQHSLPPSAGSFFQSAFACSASIFGTRLSFTKYINKTHYNC